MCLSSLPSSLSTCPHSTPHHPFPASTSASRCDYNDESVAAMCLRVWHCDVSLLALTLPLSLACLLYFLHLSISFSFISLIPLLSAMWYRLASCVSYETYTSIQTYHNNQQQKTNRNWANNLPIDFYWGQFCNSPSDLLAKWWWMQDRRYRLCQHLWY